jgi:hypothetical protein
VQPWIRCGGRSIVHPQIKECRELVINGIAERGCIRMYGSVHIFGWDHDVLMDANVVTQ